MIYLELFFTFLKIGLFSFGGGYGMIPVMKQEVLQMGWLTEDGFMNIVGISESTPGPIAVNMATFVGTNVSGIFGGLVATFAVILPAFVIMYFVAKALERFSDNKYVSAFLDGVKPVVVGFIIAVAVSLILKVTSVFNGDDFDFLAIDVKAVIIGVLVSALVFIPEKVKNVKIPPYAVIALSALLGIAVNALL